jgi:hypothetical protein
MPNFDFSCFVVLQLRVTGPMYIDGNATFQLIVLRNISVYLGRGWAIILHVRGLLSIEESRNMQTSHHKIYAPLHYATFCLSFPYFLFLAATEWYFSGKSLRS